MELQLCDTEVHFNQTILRNRWWQYEPFLEFKAIWNFQPLEASMFIIEKDDFQANLLNQFIFEPSVLNFERRWTFGGIGFGLKQQLNMSFSGKILQPTCAVQGGRFQIWMCFFYVSIFKGWRAETRAYPLKHAGKYVLRAVVSFTNFQKARRHLQEFHLQVRFSERRGGGRADHKSRPKIRCLNHDVFLFFSCFITWWFVQCQTKECSNQLQSDQRFFK